MEKLTNRYFSVEWPVKNIRALQTYRRSNVDVEQSITSDYEDFNLGLHVGDNEHKVVKNRQQLNQAIGDKKVIQWLNQVHGTAVAEVTSHSEQQITADAAVTKNPDIALAIMTADCLPILLSNDNGTEIAAIHAGWRPLANGIISNTLSKLASNPENIIAWLGPCIGPNRFQVGDEVFKSFLSLDTTLTRYFVKDEMDRYLADLQGIAAYLLDKAGITRVARLQECTVENPNKYYSYRRCNISGRMCSIIVME